MATEECASKKPGRPERPRDVRVGCRADETGDLEILAAFYDLAAGKVELLE
jgi:hypothetical protein